MRPGGPMDLEKARRQAVVETRRGVHPRRVLDGLVGRGLSEDQAARLVESATEEVADARIAAGQRNALLGGLLCAVGVALTIWTFVDAAGGGPKVVLFYGAVLGGGAQLAAGLNQVRVWRARLAGAQGGRRPSALRRERR